MTVTYHVGDVRDVIATIPDGSVDLIASSPPFLALRSYLPAGHESKGDEIGSEANPAAFLDTLLALTAEWGRVLAPHGSIAIELGDTYAGSGGAGGDYNEGGLRDGQAKFKANAPKFRQGVRADGIMVSETDPTPVVTNNGGSGWPLAKSLALIPQLYSVALAYGINPLTGQTSPAGRWRVRNVIVWHRPNPAVGALGDKVRPSTSYIVVATRSAKRWFDLTAVRTPPTSGLAGGLKCDGDAGGFRGVTDGGSRSLSTVSHAAGAPPLDAWFDEWDGTHDLWNLTTQPSSLAHYAMWPAKLAERLILMMCPREVCRVCGEPRRRVEGPSDLTDARPVLTKGGDREQRNGRATTQQASGVHVAVRNAQTLGWTDCGHYDYRPGLALDPFAGTGTTLAVADLHGRDAIGIDLDQRNRDIYPARYDEVRRALFGSPIPDANQLDLFAI